MKPRRIALTLGAAGGGVLAAAFLQPAVALADDYNITPDPTVTETFTSIGGQPPIDQAVAGLQLYDTDDLTNGDIGSFEGVSLNYVDTSGLSNQEILDTSFADGIPPAQGSLFDTVNYGPGFENVYSDLVGTGASGSNTLNDIFVTPFGDFNIPTTFDATDALPAADFTYPSTSATFPGYSFIPDSGSPEDVNALGGQPPFDQTVSGTQYYDVNDSTGQYVGDFDGVSSNGINAFGQTNQEILVAANAGFGGGHSGGGGGFHGGGGDSSSPQAGSFFDTINYGHGFENVYSDVVATGTTPQTITDTFQTPFGDVNIPSTFDAAAALPAAEFTVPSGSGAFADYSYVPDSGSSETVNSISGQALIDQTVSGTQLYDVNEPIGDTVGQFDGVSTHSIDAMGFSNQEIQVTGDVPDDFATTDDPATGSFFDTFSGYGFENLYSDVVGTDGATNTVTDNLITPFGDFSIPATFLSTAALPAAEFVFPAGSTAAELATALNPADFVAGLSSLLDLGGLFSF